MPLPWTYLYEHKMAHLWVNPNTCMPLPWGLWMQASISSANYPLPRTADERAKEQTLDRVGFAVAFSVMFGMAPLASGMVVFIVKEVRG